MPKNQNFDAKRKKLVDSLKKSKALNSRRIISAFKKTKREEFIPLNLREHAYTDEPLPIGEMQTISQPTTVAIMTEELEPNSGQKILEIGTGSGYQTAILSEILGSKGRIISLEKLPFLYELARKNLKNYQNINVFCADGTRGYPYKAPYDRIIVTAEAKKIPEHLIKQLKPGGVLIIPVKGKLLKVQKHKDNYETKELGKFAFVPLVGKY